MITTSPLRPRVPTAPTPTRAPCQCVPGTLCAPCLAYGERPPPLPSRDALRHRRKWLRDRLLREEGRLAEVLAARPDVLDETWARDKKSAWESVRRIRQALRAVEARLAREAPHG